jgi:hypothetical protein
MITIGPDEINHARNDEPVLYRCYSNTAGLLYLGKSIRLKGRLYKHRQFAPWWRHVDYITVELQPELDLALAERLAISAENPQFNIMRPINHARCINYGGRKAVPLWSDANRFGLVVPKEPLPPEDDLLERQLFPCSRCGSQALNLRPDPDTIVCEFCAHEWPFEQWIDLISGTA